VDPRPRAHCGRGRARLENIWTQGDRGDAAVRGATLVVRRGEIVAVAGVAGNGQRELAETIAGIRALTEGSLLVGGRPLRGGDPRAAIAARIAYIPEDRLGTGVAPSLSIAWNLMLKSYRGPQGSWGNYFASAAIRENAVELIRRHGIAAPGPAHAGRLLSGGNVQKVVLAREFSVGRGSSSPRLDARARPVGAIEIVPRTCATRRGRRPPCS